jgi:hypothetical protein
MWKNTLLRLRKKTKSRINPKLVMIAARKKVFTHVHVGWGRVLNNENLTQRRKDAENAKGYEDKD